MAESQAKEQVGKCARSTAVSISKRMDPVQLPKRVSREMNGITFLPVVIHVVAHLFDLARHQMRANRLMFASADLDSRRAPIPCVGTNPFKSDPVKMQQL